MFYEVVAIARDWSILILALPTLIILGGMAYVMWRVTKGVGSLVPRVRPALRSVSSTVQQVAGKIDDVRRRVQSVFIKIRTLPVKVSAFWRALRRPAPREVNHA